MLGVGLLLSLMGTGLGMQQHIIKANASLSATLAEHIGLLYESLALMQQHDSLPQIVCGNHLAVAYSLAKEGAIPAVDGINCCIYANNICYIQIILNRI